MQTKQCVQCSKTFKLDDQDLAYYKKIAVPTPTHCPICRYQRAMAWRNERYYYPRSCDLCHKALVSAYDPEAPRPVYCSSCWWSDKWSGDDYAQPIDWSRPFFEQFQKLLQRVPAIALMNDNGTQSENCEYTYDFAFGKNAYMMMSSWYAENSMYSYQSNQVKEVFDSYVVFDSELIYEGIVVTKSYHCAFVQQVHGCHNILFGFDLQGCSDCILSVGLRNKQYCIWNVQYSREEYEQRKQALQLDQWANIQRYQQEFAQFMLKFPHRYAYLTKSTECTGNNLLASVRSLDCYNANHLTDCRYFYGGDAAIDCYDVSNSGKPELCYESVTPDESYNNMFTVFCWKSQFLRYSENCHSSANLFGCVGMKQAKNAILNMAYSEADYKELTARLIEHMKQASEWGEFFPMQLSPLAYNSSVAQTVKPLTQSEIQQQGLRWSNQLPFTTHKETLTVIPETIQTTPATITQEILRCEKCERNYKILTLEYQFYVSMNLPIPHSCVECRYQARLKRMTPIQLWQRQCMCTQVDHAHQGRCANQFSTSYSPDGLELIYCEGCYQKEIY